MTWFNKYEAARNSMSTILKFFNNDVAINQLEFDFSISKITYDGIQNINSIGKRMFSEIYE